MAKKSRVSCAVMALSGALACAAPGATRKSAPPAPPAPPFQVPVAGIDMVYVKGGCYQMGNASDPGGPEERPAHEVCVDDYYLGKYEVTQDQWNVIMGSNPSQRAGCEECPVEMVSWNDAQAYIGKLNAIMASEKVPGRLRLPTEAEWEYAARSGGKAEKYAGRSDDVGSVAWYCWNSSETQPAGTRPVGRKAPNGLGLYDMTGNVWEWTNDWYGETYYSSSPRDNPPGPSSGERRVMRGGGFGNDTFDLRTTYRNFLPPGYRDGSKGFRLARTVPAQAR